MQQKIEKKALLMTWYNTNNYGTLLQAYATKEILKKRYNIDCYFVNYNPIGKRDIVSVIKKLFSIKSWKRQFLIHYSNFCFRKKGYQEKLKLRNEWVKSFTKDYKMANEGAVIKSTDEFKKLANDFEIFISGSDQIWNPEYVNEHFLLDFVPESKFCFSFASSLSASEIPRDKEKIYCKYLKKYDGITIREKECAKQLERITGKEVGVILDPTLLFGVKEWMKVKKEISCNGYVLNYFLGKSILGREKSIIIAKKRSVELYHFPQLSLEYTKVDDILPTNTELWDVSPFEWISWIENAGIIITDSFHMTVFSIMLHKEFYVIVKDEKNLQQNNRIINLLKLVGLESRFVRAEQLVEITEKQRKSVNWSKIDQILENERKKSLLFVDTIVSKKLKKRENDDEKSM